VVEGRGEGVGEGEGGGLGKIDVKPPGGQQTSGSLLP